MTDAIAQLKTYYQDIHGKRVITMVAGDFNSTPRSGVYDFMRTGTYDCLKLDRYSISGQKYAQFSLSDEPPSFTMMGPSLNIDAIPSLPKSWADRQFKETITWFTEITNTYPLLEIDQDLRPLSFNIRPSVPQSQIENESEQYKQMVIDIVEEIEHLNNENQDKDIDQYLHSSDRPFLKLINKCGPFKSAYAEVMLNKVLLVNSLKNI